MWHVDHQNRQTLGSATRHGTERYCLNLVLTAVIIVAVELRSSDVLQKSLSKVYACICETRNPSRNLCG